MSYIHSAILYKKIEETINTVQCLLCSHFCIIKEGKVGICQVRKNINGKLYTYSWGRASGLAIDPIEKKPFFHFKPESKVLSFGTEGCNFSCKNCQNSSLSQSYKDSDSRHISEDIITPEDMSNIAVKYKVDGIAYTYSEPTIFFEYARDIILEIKRRTSWNNIFNCFISNGYMSKQTLALIIKENLLDAINIDLKFISDKKYMEITGGKLQAVLDSIEFIWKASPKILLEVINLVIPAENDNQKDFKEISDFLFNLSPDIPLHFSRFYPQYKMMNKKPTDLKVLMEAKKIAQSIGLRYVYIGNTQIPEVENTYCPECHTLLIARDGYKITHNVFEDSNSNKPKCPKCGFHINIVL